MEKFVENVRFCLICNWVSKLIPAIKSRCTEFRFKPLKPEMIRPRLEHIVQAERLVLWVTCNLNCLYHQHILLEITVVCTSRLKGAYWWRICIIFLSQIILSNLKIKVWIILSLACISSNKNKTWLDLYATIEIKLTCHPRLLFISHLWPLSSINIDEKAKEALLKLSNGDMRKVINLLQVL